MIDRSLKLSNHVYSGIKVRVYCQVGKSNQGKFALDVAVKTLDLYKKYILHKILIIFYTEEV